MRLERVVFHGNPSIGVMVARPLADVLFLAGIPFLARGPVRCRPITDQGKIPAGNVSILAPI